MNNKESILSIYLFKNKHILDGLFYSLIFICGILIALFWGNEEPDKFQTILVIFVVLAVAILIVSYAKKLEIITSSKVWILVVLLKLFVTALILEYLWIPSFSNHRSLNNFDPLVFDYYGKLLVDNNFNTHLVQHVYNYVGQIYYIGIVYWLLGISTFYVGLCNTVFSLITFLTISALIVNCTGDKKSWKLLPLGMLFPELLYYDAIPGKEVISTCMTMLSLYCIYKIISAKQYKYIYLLLISSSVLISVRAVMVITVFAIGVIWLLFSQAKNKLKVILTYGSIALLIILILFPLIIKYSGGTPATVSTYLNLSENVKYGKKITPGEKSLNVMFASDNPLKAVIFAPIRSIFLLVAPFPRLGLDYSDSTWLSNFTRFSVWIILLVFPILMSATIQKSLQSKSTWLYVVFTYWLLLLFTANGALIIHERYRVMTDPLLIGTFLVGIKYTKPVKFVLLSIFLIIAGFLGYFILKYFA